MKQAKEFLQILSPFAPFITEEIWQEIFKEKKSIHLSTWPKVEGEIVEDEIVLPLQIGGKLRATIRIQSSKIKDQKYIVTEALKQENVKKYLEGKNYKTIYIHGKILNFII